MAAQRKGLGYSGATGLGQGYKPRLTRAYAEGRVGSAADANPEYNLGTDGEKAWSHGYTNKADSTYQYETQS